MKYARPFPLAPFAVVVALVVGLAGACADLETEKTPVIMTEGPHSVGVGATITIVPSTANGTDATYTFATEANAIATVTPSGVVTGVSAGETRIIVTGSNTNAKTSHAVVVLADVPGPGVPFYDEWLRSAHADPTALAFNNWNEAGEVPTTCARCHASEGFIDFIGGDGSAPGVVDQPAPTQSVIRCVTCHDRAVENLSTVTFPSGVTVDGLGREAICMTCHQGRASGSDVDEAIAAAGLTGPDQASPDLGFTNIHYYPAAATLFAGVAKGGYQYEGRVYDTRFRHVDGYNSCVGCHDPHTSRPKISECAGCHQGVTDIDGLHEVRMFSSANRDYDGDGNVAEGIYFELTGLREKVLAAIQRYGVEKNARVCYSAEAHPYWFKDTNGDGTCDAGESVRANAYASWTPRLVKAAFNYQMATKDPGAFAHNAKYILELLFDSLEDVNAALVVKVDRVPVVRGDRGHFDGSSEAARHWDADEAVEASCSRCHGGQQGFRFFVEHGVTIEVPETANGLECGTCHTSFGTSFDVLAVAATPFPGGTTLMLPGNDNLCATCHSGRTSKADIDASIARNRFTFLNVHYLPAAAVREGSAAKVGYEYPGKAYAGPLAHSGGTQCTSCHDPIASQHSFLIQDVWQSSCRVCHADANGDPHAIRLTRLSDYDGDGNVRESLSAEIAGLGDRVLAAMGTAAGTGGLCYSETAYPYFFKDMDGDRSPRCSAAESTNANRFTAWTAALMKAAHNYQLSHKDPGSWAHNFEYVGQLLYDSVENLGGSIAALVRP
jgi:predicted CXXCH cytochrome family protein